MADLPTGTVTFLFTDVEGSTRLWERDPAVMWAAIGRHNTLLDAAISTHNGHHFKTIGDAFQAAFETTPDAVAAAVAAQRDLETQAWTDLGLPGPMRVRMALHLGEATPADGDYLAPCLNRLARLLSTGYGGQLLLSQAVQELVRDDLPEGATLRDLGKHRLRDLLEPEQVFQVVVDGLPADFPPLKSLERHPTNLPIQPNPLVGREEELSAIQALIDRDAVRLVTLTGVGGSGKTRLALQAAAELLEIFEDGVFFVDLAPLVEPDFVLPTIASTLGVRETGGLSLRDSLVDYLAGKRLLLVLDNFEHVVGAAPVAADLLAACEGLKLLATSRAPLRIRGEHEYPVTPLALPDMKRLPPVDELATVASVELFMQRATAARPDFALTAGNAAAVAEVCAKLDGLPLAIELAAARVKLLEPSALLGKLSRRLRILTGGSRDLLPRQQTLRATIAWSYDLLAPDEQALFRRLAVFNGSGSVGAAEVVANAAGELHLEVLDGVTTLIDQSLLRRAPAGDDEPRFFMLDTLREFGTERLEESDEAPMTMQALATWCLDLAEEAEQQLQGAEQGVWLDRLETEHDNLRTALEWTMASENGGGGQRLAGALWRFWYMRGHVPEGRAWLERGLANGGHADIPTRIKAAQGAGTLAYLQGDYAHSAASFEESLMLAREIGNEHGIGVSLNSLGGIALEQRDFARATELFEEALGLARKIGNKGGIAACLGNLGSVAWNQGDLERAAALYEEGLALSRELGDEHGVAVSLNNLGGVAHRQGDYDRAVAFYDEGLALFRDMGQKGGVAVSLLKLGNAAREQGNPVRAATFYEECLLLAQELGDKESIAEGLQGMAYLVAAWGHALIAVRLLGAIDPVLEAIGAPRSVDDDAHLAQLLAEMRAQLGEKKFSSAWAAGRALGIDQAIAEAITILHADNGASGAVKRVE